MRVRQPLYPKKIAVTVYGHSVAKARARVVRNKKDDPKAGSHAFTPKKTVEWEASIYGQSLASKPPYPWDGPVALGVVFFKRIPRSMSKKKKQQALDGTRRPAGSRDDYDNMIKAVKDAFNGLYWLDDGQVVEYIPVNGRNPGKYYSDIPRVEIVVRFLKQPD